MVTPRILITNDDGILSKGIGILADSLATLGETWVIAPDRERNAVSNAITLHRPLRVTHLSEHRYAVNGTPSDCINIGVYHLLKEKPDLVVSGINLGANLGRDINYSGTVAAAVEAALMGIPAFAISLAAETTFNFEPAARFAIRLARFVLKNGLPEQTLLNVNVPDTGGEDIGDYAITIQGRNNHTNSIEEKVDPRGGLYYWIGRKNEKVQEDNLDNTFDLQAIRNKVISITPLALDRTNHSSVEKLARCTI